MPLRTFDTHCLVRLWDISSSLIFNPKCVKRMEDDKLPINLRFSHHMLYMCHQQDMCSIALSETVPLFPPINLFFSDILDLLWATFLNKELTSSANQKSSQQWCECLGQPSGIRDVWVGAASTSIHPFSTLHPPNSLTPYQAGLTIIWQSVSRYHIWNLNDIYQTS